MTPLACALVVTTREGKAFTELKSFQGNLSVWFGVVLTTVQGFVPVGFRHLLCWNASTGATGRTALGLRPDSHRGDLPHLEAASYKPSMLVTRVRLPACAC